MISNFKKFNEAIILDPKNWSKDLISQIKFDDDYLQDICVDLSDSGCDVIIDNTVFFHNFQMLNDRKDIYNKCYKGYQLSISNITRMVSSRDRWTGAKFSADQIIDNFPKVIKVLERIRSEFEVVVTKLDISSLRILIMDKLEPLEFDGVVFKPTAKELKRKHQYELNNLDPTKISNSVIRLTGGDKSMFKYQIKNGKAFLSLSRDFDFDKAEEILNKIISSIIKKVNNQSWHGIVRSYDISREDGGWLISFS